MRRGVVSAHHSVSIDERLNLRPTLGQGRWRRNPYEYTPHHSLKIKIEVTFLIIILLTILGLCFFHPYFLLRTFTFQGLECIEEKKLLASLEQHLDGKQYFFFSKKNYFATNLQTLRNGLYSDYSFETLFIQKKFPHTLNIVVNEKPPAFIYDNGLTYTLISQTGEKLEFFRNVEENEWQAITKTVTSTNENGEEETHQEVVSRIHKPNVQTLLVGGKKLPVLYDTRSDAAKISIVFSQQVVQGIQKWSNFLENKAIPLTYIELLDGGEEGYIKTVQGWGIYVKFSDADLAFPIFLSILPEINRSATQYIDMRYLSRVYWK